MLRTPTIVGARTPQVESARQPTNPRSIRTPIPQRPGVAYPSISQVPWTYTPQSSWVAAFRYHALSTILQIQFISGAVCEYRGITPAMAANLRNVKSKGKWVWRWVYTWPYRLVSAGKGTGRGRFRRPKRGR